ncbi:MAG TPA: hypothetical protein VFD31_02270 [Thermoleophilaceae bacterium]|nr:hypothetical protein [Thermoleophilaceae bacterium]
MGGVRRVVAIAAATLAMPTAAWAVGFDDPTPADPGQQLDTAPGVPYANNQRQDAPNDPEHDNAEPDGGTSTNLFDERFDFSHHLPWTRCQPSSTPPS